MEFYIYNQWGLLVFETQDQSKGWDGTYNGIEQPEGNYVYVLRTTTLAGQRMDQGGIITLIK